MDEQLHASQEDEPPAITDLDGNPVEPWPEPQYDDPPPVRIKPIQFYVTIR